MGRTLMYTALGALALLVLSSFFVLEHGGEEIPKPGTGSADNSTPILDAQVSLHDLTTSAGIQKYGGDIVSTSGTLYFNSSTNKFVITNGDENYPVVIDSPEGGLGQFEGKDVLVTGTFDLVPGAGPTIQATNVRLNGSATPTPKNI